MTLSKWRKQFPDGIVPPDQALEIVRQVASALDYAHGEKIVHRDIKPANIMVETLGGGESHTEPQRHRGNGASNPEARSPKPASTPAISEADVLRRKLALTKAIKAIPAEDRTDKEFAKFVGKAEDELAIAEEACKFGRFGAAAESLNAAESALGDLKKAKQTREEAERKVIRVGSQEIALRWCPAGSFTMGSPTTEEGRDSNETQHRVTLTKGFWMGETEVTQGLWKEVMGGNPSYNKAGDDYPVESVSWEDCQEFLDKLNARFPQSGLRWNLPAEAQWEYACRAGTCGTYGGTGRLDDMGWYDGNSGSKTHPVKQKQPNAWGFYDMHGNVWEWCLDWYGNYPSGAAIDPIGTASGGYRVLRGGSYWNYLQGCRSANRSRYNPGGRDRDLGFRLLAFQDGK